MIYIIFTFVVVSLRLQDIACLPGSIKIVGLFHSSDTNQEAALRYAVSSINKDKKLLSESKLIPHIVRVTNEKNFALAKRTCDRLESGIAGIFGPRNVPLPNFLVMLSKRLHIPHLNSKLDFDQKLTAFTSLNMYPSPSVLTKAYTHLLESMGWKNFAIIYEKAESFILNLLLLQFEKKYSISVWQMPESEEYSSILQQVASSEEFHIIVDCSPTRIYPFLKDAQLLGLMTEYHSYIFVSLDFSAVNLDDFKSSNCSITAFRWIDLTQPGLEELAADWAIEENKLMTNSLAYIEKTPDVNLASKITIDSVLMWDSVHLFAEGIRSLNERSQLKVKPLSCYFHRNWPHGKPLIQSLRNTNYVGLSGSFEFGREGYRENFVFDVIQLKENGIEKIGTWNESFGLNFLTRSSRIEFRAYNIQNLSERKEKHALKAVAVLKIPFLMMKDNSSQTSGDSSHYEGYIIDLIKELANILGFELTIQLAPNNEHGKNVGGKWQGSIGRLIDRTADIAVGDFIITEARLRTVECSTPFMFGGIGALYIKPKMPKKKSNIAPLYPFSKFVWLYILAAYVCTSFLLFLVSKISPYEKEGVPNDPDTPNKTKFTLLHSLFFIFGSSVLQGSQCVPRSLSARVIVGVWWFFVLMMISAYTANLSANYILEMHQRGVKQSEDFLEVADDIGIRYGFKKDGEVATYFQTTKNPKHQEIWKRVNSGSKSLLLQSDDEGIQKVIKEDGKFAYLMESPQIEYITNSNCNLMQLGKLIHIFPYSFAFSEGSPYKRSFSAGISKLREDGKLKQLKLKWWKNNRPIQCSDKEEEEGSLSFVSNSTTTKKKEYWAFLYHFGILGGIFFFLLLGMFVAFLLAIIEYLAIYCIKKRKEKESSPTLITLTKKSLTN